MIEIGRFEKKFGAWWPKLSIGLRRRWWDETDYGKGEPSQELCADIQAEIDKMGMAAHEEMPASEATGSATEGDQEEA